MKGFPEVGTVDPTRAKLSVTLKRHCRACASPISDIFVDLGVSPLANSYVDPAFAHEPELFAPLLALVCARCLLVQLQHDLSAEDIFSDYAYFSSCSSSWVEHARQFAEKAIHRLELGPGSRVVEVASNDGYLLQWFKKAGMEVLGIDPAANVAAVAEEKGIPTRVAFFGAALADQLRSEGGLVDLLVANNVIAHVPDLHDFVGGIAVLLARTGRASIEFPHLMQLLANAQFDTIYHEHFSYLSLLALEPVLAEHGLVIIDVEELPTHGGSLRVWLAHRGAASAAQRVEEVQLGEIATGMSDLSTYTAFGALVARDKRQVLSHLIAELDRGQSIAAYGAPAKGNTLFNYCGIGPDMVRYTVDRSPSKQGTLLPGSRIPVFAPDALDQDRPDIVLLMPWNLRKELVAQLRDRAWNGALHVLRPTPMIVG